MHMVMSSKEVLGTNIILSALVSLLSWSEKSKTKNKPLDKHKHTVNKKKTKKIMSFVYFVCVRLNQGTFKVPCLNTIGHQCACDAVLKIMGFLKAENVTFVHRPYVQNESRSIKVG